MAIYSENIVDIDLERGSVFRSFMCHNIAEGDANANRFGFRVKRNGQDVNIEGCTMVGYFIRADGTTVIISGSGSYSVSGNVGYITLPESCYAVDGNFTLAIKLISGNVTSAMRIIDGMVVQTTLGPIVDPGHVIPSVEDVEAAIQDALAVIAQIDNLSISNEQITGTRYRIVVVFTPEST